MFIIQCESSFYIIVEFDRWNTNDLTIFNIAFIESQPAKARTTKMEGDTSSTRQDL